MMLIKVRFFKSFKDLLSNTSLSCPLPKKKNMHLEFKLAAFILNTFMTLQQRNAASLLHVYRKD